mmetsp:Transcript_106831/g.312279  ORF Transcript_106831/g.312279 Transcript_106831/m.312279 type:complete len:285 (-) Transcript_106831:661-1515(-)
MSNSWHCFLVDSDACTFVRRTKLCKYLGTVPFTSATYASGGRENLSSPSVKTKSGSSSMLLQSGLSRSILRESQVITYPGTASSEVPLSSRATQPSLHAKGPLLGPVLRLWEEPGPADSSLGNDNWTLLKLTLQVCFPTTGTRWKTAGKSKALVSFQTRYPSEPGAVPRQREKEPTPKLSSIVGFLLTSMAASMLSFACLSAAFCGLMPSVYTLETLLIASWASSHASTPGVSGGPMPMIASNAEVERMGMWAPTTSQKVWFISAYGPMDSRSKACEEYVSPLP